jgi:hypothetical protein
MASCCRRWTQPAIQKDEKLEWAGQLWRSHGGARESPVVPAPAGDVVANAPQIYARPSFRTARHVSHREAGLEIEIQDQISFDSALLGWRCRKQIAQIIDRERLLLDWSSVAC